MAIGEISSQYRYTGKGPVDSKQLVKTYSDLLNEATWYSAAGNSTAYNGMIVAVWLDKNADKTLSDRNGIYFLFDPACTSTIKKPDVTNEANWHKIAEVDDLSDKLAEINNRLSALEAQESSSSVITYGYRNDFPAEGQPGIIYIAIDEKKSYIWFNNEYVPVGGSEYEEPQVIYGGTAD